MEKSSLNIKSFRNLLSSQSKSYKISPNNAYHPTEVKLNGLSGALDDSTGSCNIEDIYSIKRNKPDSAHDSDCRRSFTDVICGNCVKFVTNYNSSFCLTVLTPVACRYVNKRLEMTAFSCGCSGGNLIAAVAGYQLSVNYHNYLSCLFSYAIRKSNQLIALRSLSVIIIVAAIAGPLWISTEEKIPWLPVNSSLYRSNYSVSYIIKSSNASLWILCTRQGLLLLLLVFNWFQITRASFIFVMRKTLFFRMFFFLLNGTVNGFRCLNPFKTLPGATAAGV